MNRRTGAEPTKGPTMNLTLPDPRPALFDGIRLVSTLAAGVRPEQFDLPTPCAEYTVAELLEHLRGALGRTEEISRRIPLTGGLDPEPIDRDAIRGQVVAAAERARAGWDGDDALLTDLVTVPFGTLPGAAAGFGYANEMLVHAWDLATATGQQVEWPADQTLDLVRGVFGNALPAQGRDDIPFAEQVPVPDDAPAIDRLVAYSGRDPR